MGRDDLNVLDLPVAVRSLVFDANVGKMHVAVDHRKVAAGCPLGDIGGMAESVRDGVDGLYFAAGDARDLARVLRRLLQEPGLIEALARGCRPPKSIEANARELEFRYRALACRRRPRGHVRLFERSGALLEGHFRLSSGLHSTGYLQSALILQHPAHAEALGRALAAKVASLSATVVLSPALGGIVIGHEVGRALGVRAVFAERQDAVLVLRRGFVIGAGDRVLVVEDVLTTGGSTRETMRVAVAAGGRVVGVAVAQSGSSVRVAVTGAGKNGVFRHAAAEAALGKGWSAQALNGITTDAGLMMSDIHADAAYRAHLIGVMARRAVAKAG